MQSDNFDKKIKDLLSQRPPGNDKPEWEKMETLLDKHLPEEKTDNRRVFFLLFSVLLLLGGGAFLVWQTNSGSKNNADEIASQKQTTISQENKTSNTNTENTSTSFELPNTTADQPASYRRNAPTIQSNETIANRIPREELEIDVTAAKTSKTKKANSSATKPVGESNKTVDELVKSTEAERTLIEDLTRSQSDPTITEKKEPSKETEALTPITANKTAEQKEEKKETKPVAIEENQKAKQKNNSSFASNFFVTASAGPDISGVGGNPGELRLAYGAGIGYQVSKKFSVRAGFYAARKVYSADPEDYHPPTNFWTYYPNLKSIDANCKVYEIPITVDYKISGDKKQSWFVSGGVSSLLMKEETYDYYFKPNSSPNYITYTRTLYDQHKHYFSVLNLSGGYTRVLNKNISLQAEPYLKLSMTGVGYGKVDLNSGGILFSAIIKPFAKK